MPKGVYIRTEQTRINIRNVRLGTHASEESKLKASRSMMGKNTWSKGRCGPLNNSWKGGYKICKSRNQAKRARGLGFIPLNECLVDGWVGHHLDFEHVIYIPEELHKSIRHSVLKNKNMDLINDKVYDWFMEYYLRKL